MKPSRTAIAMLATGAILAALAPGALASDDTKGIAVKIQIGGHLLTQDTGFVDPEIEGSSEDSGGVLGTFIILRKDRGRFPYGFGFEIEGNGADVGPPVEPVGIQTFGIATIRILGQMEVRLRHPRRGSPQRFQPYASVGAGWNFNSVGTEISWLAAPPPPGTPRRLVLDGSPAIRIGMGFHRKATEAGLFINLEGGWNWNAGEYRLSLQDQPDQRGDYDLSGLFFLFGITLRP